ncbi:hypothetical protein BDM02DRAFT_3188091, partial [Thelephora ganbajun]
MRLNKRVPYNCFRDGCDQKFGSQRAWSQHVRRKHNVDPGTSLLTRLVSDHQDRKRKRAEQEEAQRAAKRRELETLQEELPPTEPVVPLLEQPIDPTLQRSQRTRNLPKRFLDFVPGTAEPSPLLTFFQQQQELAAQSTSAAAATDISPPQEVTPTGDTPTEPDTLTTKLDAFGVFRHYPYVPSREPSNPDPYTGFSSASWADRAPIASDLLVSVPETPPEPPRKDHGFAKACWSAWLNSGSPYKSCSESNKITKHFTDPAWNWQDFVNYNAYTESRRFDRQHFSKKAAL